MHPLPLDKLSRRGPRTPRLSALLLVGALMFVCGCGAQGERIFLHHWTLVSEGHETPIVLPRHVDKLVPSHPSTYRLETQVVLPIEARGSAWDLGIPFLAGPTELLVNGAPAPSLESNVVNGYRAYTPHTYLLTAETTRADRLDLTLVVHSTWLLATFLDTGPRLYRHGEVDRGVSLARIANGDVAAVSGTAIGVMGLTYLAVYFSDKRRRAYLWAGLQATLGAYYAFYVAGGTQLGLGHYEANTEAVALIIAPIAGVYFSHSIFELPRPSRAWLALGVVSAIPPLFIYDPFVLSKWVFGAVACVGIGVVYQTFVCVRLLLKPEPPMGAGVLLAAWLLLGIASATDLLGWLGQGDLIGGARGGPLGLGLFGVLQALLLSRQHARSMLSADALNVQLQGRVVELEQRERDVRQLNDELRRQIGDRSRHLFTALAVVGGRGAEAPALADGMVIDDRYVVVRKVGAGGMGTVYEVYRTRDGARLALKVAHSRSGVDLSRLAREAHLASRVSHANVVGVLDVDVATQGFLYIVLEYVDAPSLSTLKNLEQEVPFAREVLRQIADGLAALHEAGIVHRDLKPENVLIGKPPHGELVVKLLDFGISRDVDPESLVVRRHDAADDSGSSSPTDPTRQVARPAVSQSGATPRVTPPTEVTQVGTICGTPKYIAPEVADATDRLSPAADVFAFGVLAFELLTNTAPFEIAPIVSRLAGNEVIVPPRVQKVRPLVPATLATLVDDCLCLDPAHRPTVKDLVARLRPET